MEQYITNIINHCIMTVEEGMGCMALNTKQVGAVLREVFPFQDVLGLDLPCGAAQGNICCNLFHFWDAVSTLRPASLHCNALGCGSAGRS